jgi:hypothetical protein
MKRLRALSIRLRCKKWLRDSETGVQIVLREYPEAVS